MKRYHIKGVGEATFMKLMDAIGIVVKSIKPPGRFLSMFRLYDLAGNEVGLAFHPGDNIYSSGWGNIKDLVDEICRCTYAFVRLDINCAGCVVAINPYRGAKSLEELKVIRDMQ